MAFISLLPLTTRAAGPATAPTAGKLGTPVQLFNGKDLSGWVFVTRPPPEPATQPAAKVEDVWSVKDGVIHCVGKPNGYIRTEKEFPPHFVLTIEYRHVTKGNSGFFFAISGPDKVWPRCLEVQGNFGAVGEIRNIGTLKVTPADPARVAQQGRQINKLGPADAEKPLGEWNTLRITVDGAEVGVSVNDQLENVLHDCEDLTGKIALQSEGATMEFRKVELTPIE
jgi:hypothetical protein